jgi:hypothetical protein
MNRYSGKNLMRVRLGHPRSPELLNARVLIPFRRASRVL